MVIVTATEMKNNFGKYLSIAMKGEEIIIMKNGKEVARLTSSEQVHRSIADELLGMFKTDREIDPDKERDEYFKEKYKL